MRYTKIMPLVLVGLLLLAGCGQSYEETKRISREQRLKQLKEDSAALKIAVMPTLDCLPLYLAKDHQMFDTAVDIRLKQYTAQMDIDTALTNHRVQLGVTDLVRAERLLKQGTVLSYVTKTNAYWQLISNRVARITDLKHLDDKMLAMTRYSVTDLLGELNEMDALLMTEPQAAQARLLKHKVLLDTRKLDLQMGVVVAQGKGMDDKNRKRQMEAFEKGYKEAVDSINHYGVAHYKDLIVKYCKVKPETVDLLDKTKFEYIAKPRPQDIERAQKWLSKH